MQFDIALVSRTLTMVDMQPGLGFNDPEFVNDGESVAVLPALFRFLNIFKVGQPR